MKQRFLLSIGQVSRVLGINVSTLRRMVTQGLLKCVFTEGGHRQFTIGEVDKFKRLLKKYRDDYGITYLPESK